MLPLPLILVAPFLLAAPAAAAPKHVAAGSGEELGARCVAAVTKTTTTTKIVYVTATPKSTFLKSSPSAASKAASQKSSPSKSPLSQKPAATAAAQPPSASARPGNATSVKTTPPAGYRNALYFTNWGIYGANFQPQQLPVSQISHVLYAFADIAADGEVKSSDAYADIEKHYPTDSWNDQGNNAYGCVKQLYILKKKNRHLKVLLSIGGWTYSPKFPPVAATEAGRQRFCSSAVRLVQNWGFDGIDIDWEYPANANEAQHFVLLLQTCRAALDRYAAEHAPGHHLLITIAAPAGPQHYNIMELAQMDRWIDAWHLMAYDYAGSWDSTSGHQSNLFANGANPQSTKFSTERAVRDYVAKGVPASKIALGLPLYGRAFEATTGLGQPYNGIGPGSVQSGVWLYRDLPRPGAQELWDDVAMASYSYDPATKELISYDTIVSATAKAEYLTRNGLGGAVFWEASGDRPGAASLVGTLASRMGRLDSTENLLAYPASIYDNIRAGMPGA